MPNVGGLPTIPVKIIVPVLQSIVAAKSVIIGLSTLHCGPV